VTRAGRGWPTHPVAVPAGGDDDALVVAGPGIDPVDQPVLARDAAPPSAGRCALRRLRIAEAGGQLFIRTAYCANLSGVLQGTSPYHWKLRRA
jgi:hypothetical protein